MSNGDFEPVDLTSPAAGGSLFNWFLASFAGDAPDTSAPGASYQDVLSGPAAQGFAGLVAAAQAFQPLQEPVPLPNIASCTQDMAHRVADLVYQWLRGHGWPQWLAWLLAGLPGVSVLILCDATAVLLFVLKHLGEEIASFGIQFIGAARKDLDPQVAVISTEILNELMGTDYAAQHLPTGGTVADHVNRAGAVGHILHAQLMSEFAGGSDVTADKGKTAAERFTGLLVNFGTATGIIAYLGGAIPWLKLDEIREIPEQVARNLGLGRAHRMILKVILDPLVVKPYTWWINQRFHPAVFTRGDVLNPFTSTLMSQQAVFDALDLEGFSHDKVEQLIKLHQKRLTLEDVETLRRWGYWSDDVVHKYLVELGWPEDLADTARTIPELRRLDARINRLVDFLEAQTDAGHMTVDDAIALIKTLPVTADEVGVIQATFAVRQHTPHASMTVAQMQAAFEQGIFTLGDAQAWLAQRGYTGDDQATLLQLTLLKFATREQAIAVARFAYDAKVAAAVKAHKPAPPKPAILA
jgi:hypothetical protein